jgi:beta-lactamase class A
VKARQIPARWPVGLVRDGRVPRFSLAVFLVFFAACLLSPQAPSAAEKPVLLAAVPPAAPPQWGDLERTVGRIQTGFRGVISVYIEDLQTGRSIAYNESVPIPAASVIKVPVAVALYEQELQGKITLDTEVVLRASDKADGSGVLKRVRSGTRLTVANLLELMIQRSDNTATNLLTDLISLEEVNNSCRRQGLAVTCMPRAIMDLEARDLRSIENYTSAADMARLMKGLYFKKILDAASCDQILEIMKGQKVRDRLPRYLPPGVVVAHKTGLMNNICHDVGIIYGGNHDYVVAVLTADFPSFRYAKDAIGKVGRMVYQYDRGEPLTIVKQPQKKAPGVKKKPPRRSSGKRRKA